MDTLTAFHEAGHATVSFLLGEMPEQVTIRPEGDSLGHMRYLGVEARGIAEAAVRGSTKADRDRVMAYLISTAAGPAAQALKMRQGSRTVFFDQTSWETFDGGQDFAQADRVMQAASRLLVVDMDDIMSEAFDLLEQPAIWSSVEHLAADLLRFKELGYENIRDAVMNHDLIGGR
jgi:hypothetical protein